MKSYFFVSLVFFVLASITAIAYSPLLPETPIDETGLFVTNNNSRQTSVDLHLVLQEDGSVKKTFEMRKLLFESYSSDEIIEEFLFSNESIYLSVKVVDLNTDSEFKKVSAFDTDSNASCAGTYTFGKGLNNRDSLRVCIQKPSNSELALRVETIIAPPPIPNICGEGTVYQIVNIELPVNNYSYDFSYTLEGEELDGDAGALFNYTGKQDCLLNLSYSRLGNGILCKGRMITNESSYHINLKFPLQATQEPYAKQVEEHTRRVEDHSWTLFNTFIAGLLGIVGGVIGGLIRDHLGKKGRKSNTKGVSETNNSDSQEYAKK